MSAVNMVKYAPILEEISKNILFPIVEDGGRWTWSIWMLDFSNIEIGKKGSILSHLQRFKRIKEQLERIRGQYDR